MGMSRKYYTFLALCLLLDYHHSEAGRIGAINGVMSIAAIGLGAVNQATGGCMYYPSICTLRDECKELHSEVTQKKPSVDEKNETLNGLNEYNAKLWTATNEANNKNTELATIFQALEKYSISISRLTDGIDLTTSTIGVLQSAAGAIMLGGSLDKSLREQESQEKATFNNVEVPFLMRTVANGFKTSVKPASKTAMTSSSSLGRKSTGKVGTFFKSAKWSKFGKVGGALAGGVLLGVSIYFDVSGAKAKRNELKTARDALRTARDDMVALLPQLNTAINSQSASKETVDQEFASVKEKFISLGQVGSAYSREFLEVARLPSVNIANPPQITEVITAATVNVDNIVAKQETLKQYISSIRKILADAMGLLENNPDIKKRVTAVGKMKELLINFGCVPAEYASQMMIPIGKSFDDTLTDADVMALVRRFRPDILDGTCVNPGM
ncbi:unnamed protein product [Owenia fusiformis]|uniref:Uncharacterized protein n=1 Tax=Owenia fusiformis TaxID=6347 RepID=A0A8J1T660_OWEFU|nr:unnamed protein product [Owenia fusiformis]